MMTKEQRKKALTVGRDIKERKIRALYKAGYTIPEISVAMGTSESLIQRIIKRLDVI